MNDRPWSGWTTRTVLSGERDFAVNPALAHIRHSLNEGTSISNMRTDFSTYVDLSFVQSPSDTLSTNTLHIRQAGHAYRCFCSPDRLAETHQKLKSMGSNATYDRACMHLTEEEVARRVRSGERNVVRLNVSFSFILLPSTCQS